MSATGISSSKLGAVKMSLAELATSSNCAGSTFGPIPKEYTLTFLSLSPREATESSTYGPRSIVCLPSVITIAIYKMNKSRDQP